MDQIYPKRTFRVRNGKSKHHHCILRIEITLSTKFHFTHTILNFGTKFTQKGYFQSKTKKANSEFCICTLVKVPNFSLNWKFWFFGPNCTKRTFLVKKSKIEHQHWILHIPGSLNTKLQLRLIVLIFQTKFAQKHYFCSQTEKVNTTMEFCIFEFV